MWGWNHLQINIFLITEAPFWSSRYESRTSGCQGPTSDTWQTNKLGSTNMSCRGSRASLFCPYKLPDIPWGHWMRMAKNGNLKQAAVQWFTKNRVSLGLQTARPVCRPQVLWLEESEKGAELDRLPPAARQGFKYWQSPLQRLQNCHSEHKPSLMSANQA